MCYPKPTPKPIFQNLVRQLHGLSVAVHSSLPASLDSYHLLVDAVFGFSFRKQHTHTHRSASLRIFVLSRAFQSFCFYKWSFPLSHSLADSLARSSSGLLILGGEVRAPFDTVLERLRGLSVPIVSVDIPSGPSLLVFPFAPPSLPRSLFPSLSLFPPRSLPRSCVAVPGDAVGACVRHVACVRRRM